MGSRTTMTRSFFKSGCLRSAKGKDYQSKVWVKGG
jgi:hypothetical protein